MPFRTVSGSCTIRAMKSARYEWIAAALVLLVATAVYFGPALFSDQVIWTANTSNWFPWKADATGTANTSWAQMSVLLDRDDLALAS